MKYCDLHNHSNFSDGSNTPSELIEIAKSKGLSALALTDTTQ
jgi:predicted metal-dependent phosphoesterase TrpH